MIYLCNGFSQSMMRDPNMKQIPFPLSENEFKELVQKSEFTSVIGHNDLAECLSRITGEYIEFKRRAITVNYDDLILLVSLNGRLPEHPNFVEYKGRLNYTFLRFEKQTAEDIAESIHKIHEISY